MEETKFCKHCGTQIPKDAVICTACGRQVEENKQDVQQPNDGISNLNNSIDVDGSSYSGYGLPRNKWISIVLCFFFGWLGAHKFYEGKDWWGVIYLCTGGLIGIGSLVDFIILLFKPNTYYVPIEKIDVLNRRR